MLSAGQLLKRELQEENDNKWQLFRMKKKHKQKNLHKLKFDQSTQVDGKMSEKESIENKEIKKVIERHNKIRRKRNCAFITWTLILLFALMVLITSLVLVFHNPTRDHIVTSYFDNFIFDQNRTENMARKNAIKNRGKIEILCLNFC